MKDDETVAETMTYAIALRRRALRARLLAGEARDARAKRGLLSQARELDGEATLIESRAWHAGRDAG